MEKENVRVRYEHKMTSCQMQLMVDGELIRIDFKGGLDKGKLGRTPGIYNTSNPKIIEALDKRPDFGKRFFKSDVVKTKAASVKATATVEPSEPTIEHTVSEEEVNTIQEAKEWLVKNYQVPTTVNTGAKISEWLKANPGKVMFQSPNLQGLYS